MRERPTEILPLADVLLAEACRKIERARVPRVAPEAASKLEKHAWPGNVRELRNAIDRAAVLCLGDVVLPEHLPAKIAGDAKAAAPPARDSAPGGGSFGATMPTVQVPAADVAVADKKNEEKRRILEVLDQCAGNQTRAAEILGISRRTLVSRLEEYDLPRPRKR